MSIFLAMAAFILMVAAPFLVMAAVVAAIICGLAAFIKGLATARPARAMIGAFLLTAGAASGVTLFHWTITKPAQGDTSSPHAHVHGAWEQTRLRYQALKWMTDGTFERLAKQQRDKRP